MAIINPTKEERDSIERLSLFFGESFTRTRDFLESLYIYAVFQQVQDDEISLPFFGKLKLSSVKDELLPEGRAAKLEVDFQPSRLLRKAVGQIKDGTITDAERILLNRIASIFSRFEEDAPDGQ